MYGHSPPRGKRTTWHRIAPVLLVLTLLACSIPFISRAVFAADAVIGLNVEYFQQDSARVIARWAPGRDAKGQTDSYIVRWSSGAVQRNVTKATTADTFKVKRPAFGDSALVSVAVTGIRRGVPSSPVSASVWVRNPDAAPPPIDSLKVDTTDVYSLRIEWTNARGVAIADPAAMRENDTIYAIAKYTYAAGHARPANDKSIWTTERTDQPLAQNYLQSVTLGVRRDTLRLVALPCNCEESGSPNVQFNLARGAYEYRTASGYMQPVTPVAASGFR